MRTKLRHVPLVLIQSTPSVEVTTNRCRAECRHWMLNHTELTEQCIATVTINRLKILVHLDTHTHTHTHAHTCTHTHTHARTHAHAHTHAHTRMHARTHTHTHARTHAHTHAHTHHSFQYTIRACCKRCQWSSTTTCISDHSGCLLRMPESPMVR